MNSLRAISIAGAILLAAAMAFSDDDLLKGKGRGGGGGSSSSQGNSKPRDNGPRDQGSKPRDNGPSRPRDDGPKPRDDGPKPRDNGPRPRDEGPKPRDNGPKGNNDDLIKPRPGNGGGAPSQGPSYPERKPRNDDNRPKPRQDSDPPRGNGGGDDLLRPRPGNGNPGNGNPGGGNQGPGTRPRGDDRPISNFPRGGNDGPLGRVDSPASRPGQGRDSLLGRKGSNAYGGQINNINREGRNTRPIQIDRAPIDIFKGGLANQVRREDNPRLTRNWRTGYYHYNRSWCDDYFFFGFYVFDPYASSNCFVSPWYYYPHLPAYVSSRCVRVININLSPWSGAYYNWHRPYGYDNYDTTPLDYAIDDITRAFERSDYRALRRLVPYNERVAIFVDGEYTYSMEPDDFENFMLDAIEETKTLRYEITRVERRGREAQIEARHEYEDPWGRRTTVYHSYRLEQDRGNFVITRFGTSYYRNW